MKSIQFIHDIILIDEHDYSKEIHQAARVSFSFVSFLYTKACTLIDNILTNVIEPNHDKAGILTSHISDHRAIFLSTNFKLSRDSGSK